jgi:hypothetical protein
MYFKALQGKNRSLRGSKRTIFIAGKKTRKTARFEGLSGGVGLK